MNTQSYVEFVDRLSEMNKDPEQMKHLAMCFKLIEDGYRVHKIDDKNDRFFILCKPSHSPKPLEG
jgi:hypothetical protein